MELAFRIKSILERELKFDPDHPLGPEVECDPEEYVPL